MNTTIKNITLYLVVLLSNTYLFAAPPSGGPPPPTPPPPPGLPIDNSIIVLFFIALTYGLFALNRLKTQNK